MAEPTPDSYFESMYAGDDDPWGFDTRNFERRKYDLTIAALARRRYRAAYEPGCANGALTERLAKRCDRVVACDIVEGAVERARVRLATTDGVDVRSARFPHDWPDEPFDLVVWSEVAYYLDDELLDVAIEAARRHLDGDGELVVVNYTGATNYPLTADEVDDRIDRSGAFRRRCSLRDEWFRLDTWVVER